MVDDDAPGKHRDQSGDLARQRREYPTNLLEHVATVSHSLRVEELLKLPVSDIAQQLSYNCPREKQERPSLRSETRDYTAPQFDAEVPCEETRKVFSRGWSHEVDTRCLTLI